MIPYEIVIPSASRPHLLARTLGSLLVHVDQKPTRIIVHNDECFPGKAAKVQSIVRGLAHAGSGAVQIEMAHGNDAPPIGHGPSIHWLLDHVTTELVLYSQDDHEVVRPLPIIKALEVMQTLPANHIRFNKRATMERKGIAPNEFIKVPVTCGDVTLCVSDHWYFQTSLWRVAAIKPVIAWWMAEGAESFKERCEIKVNNVFNGQIPIAFPPEVPRIPAGRQWNDPMTRHEFVKTYVWGKPGEDRFVNHIGDQREDWALARNRG